MNVIAKNVAAGIFRQLCATIGENALMSWGFNSPRPIVVNDLPGIAFRVSGRLFSGVVIVLLNEDDTYQIKTISETDKELQTLCEACYCDDFAEIIDTFVEVGDDWQEYQKFCEGEKTALENMGINENTKIYIV